MAHHYFGINVDIVWQIINNELPMLKNNLNKIADSQSAPPKPPFRQQTPKSGKG
ncbi:HepT-like ribonuclease domain-containing protein [Roseimarinus sediminis]|uniref:HepT-like ribonuclease domain-containing protein n=1 Tax=Roseimarinus sediminis TaxID=1610899 RepID=UPI003D1EFEC5